MKSFAILSVMGILLATQLTLADYVCRTVDSVQGKRVGTSEVEPVDACSGLKVDFVIKTKTPEETRAARAECETAINKILYQCCSQSEALRQAHVATVPERAPAQAAKSASFSSVECR